MTIIGACVGTADALQVLGLGKFPPGLYCGSIQFKSILTLNFLHFTLHLFYRSIFLIHCI